MLDLKNNEENQKYAKEELDKLADGNPVVVEVLKKIPHNPDSQQQFCNYLRDLANERPDDSNLGKFKDEVKNGKRIQTDIQYNDNGKIKEQRNYEDELLITLILYYYNDDESLK